MTKKLREEVYRKYKGHCAYCGSELKGSIFQRGKAFQVDHIEPVHRQCIHADRRIKDAEDIEMLHPACARCNRYKSNFTLEEFRDRIAKQVHQARKRSWNFRCAEDFGLIVVVDSPVLFYFEKERCPGCGDTIRPESGTDFCPNCYTLLEGDIQ